MSEEIRNTNITFSHEELDVINKFIDRNEGVKTMDEKGFIWVESETKSVSFKLNRHEEQRHIMVCITEFGNYNPHVCVLPVDIQRVLGL